ncbi:MAG: cytochrome c [Nitrospinae bacterium]|nr:cytochrome c [Nitrospinota bacterium]
MKVSFFTGVIIISGWILAGSLFADSHHAPVDIELGEKIYHNRCQACHGEQGDGKTFAANALHPSPKNFTSTSSKKELTRKRMLKSITQGRPGTAMMPWKDVLSPQEIQAVLNYVRQELMRLEPQMNTDGHR